MKRRILTFLQGNPDPKGRPYIHTKTTSSDGIPHQDMFMFGNKPFAKSVHHFHPTHSDWIPKHPKNMRKNARGIPDAGFERTWMSLGNNQVSILSSAASNPWCLPRSHVFFLATKAPDNSLELIDFFLSIY